MKSYLARQPPPIWQSDFKMIVEAAQYAIRFRFPRCALKLCSAAPGLAGGRHL